jgi:cytochrome c-type biogenesis protein CcmH/NrfG
LQVVRQKPNDSGTWRILGMCRMAAGDCHEAVRAGTHPPCNQIQQGFQ